MIPTLYVQTLASYCPQSSCGKVMFSQVSVCYQGGGVHHPVDKPDLLAGRHPPPLPDKQTPYSPPTGRQTPCQANPPLPTWVLQWTVPILLECILVCNCFHNY